MPFVPDQQAPRFVPDQPAGPSVGGALDALSTGVVNAAAGMGNAAIDIGSRALGQGPRKPIPYQTQTPAAQATLKAAGDALDSLGGPSPDEQMRQQIIDQRNKQLDGTFLGDVRDNAREVLPEAAQVAPVVGAVRAGIGAISGALDASAARNLVKPMWRQAGFASEDDAAAYATGFRNGEGQSTAQSLAGSEGRKALTNNNADVGNVVAHHVSGVPFDTPLSYRALDDALEPLKAVYRRAAAGLGQNGDQIITKLGQLRKDGFKALGDTNPEVVAQGRAMLQEAEGLEDLIGKNIKPDSGTSLEQFQAARKAFAQNRAVYDSLQGDELDLRYLGRMYQNAPDKFADGPLRDAAIFATKPRNAPYVGARIVGDDIAIRQAVGGVQLGKPGTWAGAANITRLPQMALRKSGEDWARRMYRGRDDSIFDPLPPQ